MNIYSCNCLALLSALAFPCLAFAQTAMPPANTFSNPLLPVGPDPWVANWKGFCQHTNSTGGNVMLRKTADITDLGDPSQKTVWAPELHRFALLLSEFA